MKPIALAIFLISTQQLAIAQKRSLDFSVNDSWPEITSWDITPNGKYAAYQVGNDRVLQSTDGTSFKKEILDATNFELIDDQYYTCMKGRQNMLIGKFGDTSAITIENVSSGEAFKSANVLWLAYLTNDSAGTFILQNLITSEKITVDKVEDYYIGQGKSVLLLKTKSTGKDNQELHSLTWISLPSKTRYSVANNQTCDFQNYCVSSSDSQVAFVAAKEVDGEMSSDIMYFRPGMQAAKTIVSDRNPRVLGDLTVQNSALKFSSDCTQLFFSLEKRKKTFANVSGMLPKAKVDIWSYKDTYLQSEQQSIYFTAGGHDLMAVYNFSDSSIIQLQGEQDASLSSFISRRAPDGYRLIETGYNLSEANWRTPFELYIVTTQTGTKKKVTEGSRIYQPQFSCGGKFVLYYNRDKKHYFTYNVVTGKTTNITKAIPFPIFSNQDSVPGKPYPVNMSAVVGWLEDDKAVIINDEFDVWQVDPAGLATPINLTNGYGRKHHITLRCLKGSGTPLNMDPINIQSDSLVLFTGFDHLNKYNGFYQKKFNDKGDPVELFMGPYIFHYTLTNRELNTYEPLKAAESNMFLVRRMSDKECENVFSTRDFQKFTPLSHLEPQSPYNWYMSELLRWKMPTGQTAEGILYKPEDFNPQKKYPVIFTFYERNSDYVHRFLYPKSSRGELNIPYYVSNGYLVFVPNVYYSIGKTAESVYQSVMSAAKFICTKSWVDKTKMGIEGLSFGAYEVNVLVTKSNLFAAAAESAGVVDFISGYGDINIARGSSLQYLYEDGQNRIGETLWGNRKAYIDNSPIFNADKVSTPLLIMHNKLDYAVPWSQGVQWFTALRRLDKKVWMLQYDNENHGIAAPQAKIDYTIRQAQFFDHYLKSKPAPNWMTKGIDASEKTNDNGLALDPGAKP